MDHIKSPAAAGDFFVIDPSHDSCTRGNNYCFQVQLLDGNNAAIENSQNNPCWFGRGFAFMDYPMDRMELAKPGETPIPVFLDYFHIGIIWHRIIDHDFNCPFSKGTFII